MLAKTLMYHFIEFNELFLFELSIICIRLLYTMKKSHFLTYSSSVFDLFFGIPHEAVRALLVMADIVE